MNNVKDCYEYAYPQSYVLEQNQEEKNVRLCNTPQFIRNPAFAYAKTKAMISCANTAQLINAFVLATCLPESEIDSL